MRDTSYGRSIAEIFRPIRTNNRAEEDVDVTALDLMEDPNRRSYRRDIRTQMASIPVDDGFLSTETKLKSMFITWMTGSGIASLGRVCRSNLRPDNVNLGLEWKMVDKRPPQGEEIRNKALKAALVRRDTPFTKREFDKFKIPTAIRHYHYVTATPASGGDAIYFQPVAEESTEPFEISEQVLRYLAENAVADMDLMMLRIEAMEKLGNAGLTASFSWLPFGDAHAGLISKVILSKITKTFKSFWVRNKPFLTFGIMNMLRDVLKIGDGKHQYFTFNNRVCSQPALTHALHKYMLGNCAFFKASELSNVKFHSEQNKQFFRIEKDSDPFYVKVDTIYHFTVDFRNDGQIGRHGREVRGIREEWDLNDTMSIRFITEKGEYIFRNVRLDPTAVIVNRIPVVVGHLIKGEGTNPY